MEIKEKIAYALATCFGLTDTRLAPGTIGSLLALPLCIWPIKSHDPFLHAVLIAAVFVAGIWCVPIAQAVLPVKRAKLGSSADHDHGQITIDEVLGMLIATLPLHFVSFGSAWFNYTLAFGLFRFFDIFKRGPVAYIDAWESKWGVMLDDAVAGIMAGGSFWALVRVWELF